MKTIIKKNQLMITALAIMIAIAGYLQFAENTIKEEPGAELASASSGKVITENYVAGNLKKDSQKQETADTILELSRETS